MTGAEATARAERSKRHAQRVLPMADTTEDHPALAGLTLTQKQRAVALTLGDWTDPDRVTSLHDAVDIVTMYA